MPTSEHPQHALFSALEPALVWRHFEALCRIPRPSKHEHGVRSYVLSWARQHQIAAHEDAAGNLHLRVPASPGRTGSPEAVLQAHMDMVCQKNTDCAHDFHRDPIQVERSGDWLLAPHTTLGADDGIGVALILAALEDPRLEHGPLHGLLTADEEDGMGGAQGVEVESIQARYMINLDTEEWGEFYLGCAGGIDVNVARPGSAQAPSPGSIGCSLTVSGLRGGHSGVDIHEGRGNAIKLLVRVLLEASAQIPLRLSTLSGGTARNALPREAVATFALAPGDVAALEARIAALSEHLHRELDGVEAGWSLTLDCSRSPGPVMSQHEQEVWLNSLHAAPYGVQRMSTRVPGVVETSNNLGIVRIDPERGSANFMVRSLQDSSAMALAGQIRSLFLLSGSQVDFEGQYPGWSPNPASPLLAHCQSVYQQLFDGTSTVKVIHAGLECGIIGAKAPGLDTVSFGPTIRGAHAPGECVHIDSVSQCWHLLRAVISSLPQPV